MDFKNTKRVRVGGLWIKESAKGATYLTGSFDTQRIQIWKNNYKADNEKAPDYVLYKLQEVVEDATSSPTQGESTSETPATDDISF